ncbi:MAG: Ig-like domain-containing protein [Lachnospiraceae bacterium]|nr:Ig-like domain-containing protein [Lachnospiraceae bacterium]
MYNGQTRKNLKKLLLVILFIGLITNGQIAFAADNTVRIYIGNGTDTRHHMSMSVGSISDEYSYTLKGYTAKSSVYSSSNEAVFQIVKTGDGKCKIKGLKEGTGWVVLTIKTTDGKTLTERVFISVYSKIEQCEAVAVKEVNLYRGASANAGVENEDKKGVLSDNEKVTILSKCEDYYYIIRKDGSDDKGFTRKENLRILVKDVKVKEQNVSIETGKSRTLTAKVTPDLADTSGLSWKSGDSAVVSVDDFGNVKGISEGTTTVSITSKDGNNSTGSTYISVYNKINEVPGIIKSNTDLYAIGNNNNSIGKGKAKTKLTIVGTCGDYYRVKTNIQAIKEDYNGYCYILKSKVQIPVSKIKLDSTEIFLSPGESAQLSAVISPEMADNHNVTWSSSKKSVAVVNKNGYVTAKKAGNVTITVTSVDGAKTDKCVVHVTGNKEKSKEVSSKPDLFLESNGMNSISVGARNEVEYDGLIVYVNGKKYDDCEFSKKSWWWTVTYSRFHTNKTYKIKVKTYTEKDGKKTYSKMSDEHKITVGKTGINANVTAGKSITVSWKKMEQANMYRVYRAGKKNGKYKLIKTVKGNKTSYTDKNVKLNKTYYYKVKPVTVNGTVGSSNIDYAKVSKIGTAEKYMAKKYNFICTDSKNNMNSYNIKGCYSPVKYKMANGILEIHVYLEFVTYSDTGQKNAGNVKIFKKKPASVKGEITTQQYISMFKEGIEAAYSDVKVKGNKGDFKKGINFKTKLIIHDKKGKEKYNSKQEFVEVLIGGECPNCTKKGDHWYHSGNNHNASGYTEYKYIYCIYMPTNEQVRANKGYNYPATDYAVTAAHELGHILGLDDAYYDAENKCDRCADNKETGYKYDKNVYDNLMKHHRYDESKKINANGIEMILQAVDPNTGMPKFASQCFKSYGDETISDVIKNHNDYQKDHD